MSWFKMRTEMLKKHDQVKSAYADLNMVKWDSEHENLYEQKWDKVNLAYKEFLISVKEWLESITDKSDESHIYLHNLCLLALDIGDDNGLYWNKYSRGLYTGIDVIIVPLAESELV